MLKVLTLLMVSMFAFTCPSFSAEEEEAQTRPNPLMRQKEISSDAQDMQSSKMPGIIAGRLYKEGEKAQKRHDPHMNQSAIQANRAGKLQAAPAAGEMN